MREPPGPYRSLTRTALAGLALAAVFAFPVVLFRLIGGPLPGGALTQRISTEGVTGTRRVPAAFLIEFAGCLLWLAWALVLVALLVELAGLLRSRTSPLLEGIRPLQEVHRSLLEQVVQGTRRRGRRSPPPSLEQLLRRADVPSPIEPARGEGFAPSDDLRAYEVTAFYTGDGARLERETFWTIARDQLGDPRRWRQVAEANRTLLEEHGRSVADPGWPEPGWILLLPGDADE